MTSSALPMKAVKILGSVEHAADLNALRNCGWIIDEEKDCIKKKFQFKDFNQVCETFKVWLVLRTIVNFWVNLIILDEEGKSWYKIEQKSNVLAFA